MVLLEEQRLASADCDRSLFGSDGNLIAARPQFDAAVWGDQHHCNRTLYTAVGKDPQLPPFDREQSLVGRIAQLEERAAHAVELQPSS